MYKIVELLNISKSLHSQKESNTEHVKDVHKVVMTRGKETFIVFFMDGIDVGPGSLVHITNRATFPLIFRTDYYIENRQPYVVNEVLIQKLLDGNNKNKK